MGKGSPKANAENAAAVQKMNGDFTVLLFSPYPVQNRMITFRGCLPPLMRKRGTPPSGRAVAGPVRGFRANCSQIPCSAVSRGEAPSGP